MKKRIIRIFWVIFLLASCFLTVNAEEPEAVEDSPEEVIEVPEIIETISITPDPISLLEEQIDHTENWEKDCEDTTLCFSQEDAERLLKIAWSEAGNQGIKGQLLVMEVVINRVRSDKFPNTIQDVIEKSGFSSYINGVYGKAAPTWETHQALANLEKNIDLDTDIIAFETTSNNKTLLRYFDYAYTYKDHDFFVWKKEG